MRVEGLVSRVESQKRAAALRSNSVPRPSTLAPRPSPLAPRPSPLDPRPSLGMTLIELLVVVVIITTLVAAAIPLISPSNDSRRLREAARGLNTFINGAQSRAIGYHRPYGVAIKKLPNENGMSVEAYYVEQQPPYAGFDANSRACVAIHPTATGLVLIRFLTRGGSAANLPMGWIADLFPSNTIRPGDVIEINGTQYELLNDANLRNIGFDSTNTYFESLNNGRPPQIVARPLNDSGQQINPRYDDQGIEIGTVVQARSPYWTRPAPYKILRQPTPASDQPYQMPEGTGIDLRASGVGRDNYFYVPGFNDNNDGILIMFAPEGRISRVSYSQQPVNNIDGTTDQSPAFDQPVVDNVYLLVGRRDRTPPAVGTPDPTLISSTFTPPKTEEEIQKLKEPINWLNGSSQWIVIGAQSGRIVTIENGVADIAAIAVGAGNPEVKRNEQIFAAREFTREMGQVGGR